MVCFIEMKRIKGCVDAQEEETPTYQVQNKNFCIGSHNNPV
jgi:hypothetical protein